MQVGIKCGSDVGADLKRGHISTAILWAVWGFIVSVLASGVSGLAPLDDPTMVPVLGPVGGFVVYGTGQAILLSWIRVPEGQTRCQVFRYYFFRFPLVDFGLGLVCAGIGIYISQLGYNIHNLIAFLLYTFLMACRDLTLPAWYVTFVKKHPGSWLERYRGLATTKTGEITMSRLAAAVSVAALGSGVGLLFD